MWKIVEALKALVLYIYIYRLKIVFLWIFLLFIMLQNIRKHEKLSLHKVFHQNKRNASIRYKKSCHVLKKSQTN